MFYFFYYFPLGMDVRPRRGVWATWAILSLCVLGFLLARQAPNLFWQHYEKFVFIPSVPTPSALILNVYAHGGWLHLISNLVSLVVFGPALEDRLGARRFLMLFHLFGLIGNVVQAILAFTLAPETATYGILGASGAIAGLMGLFMVRFYFAHLRVGYWTFMPLQAFTRAGTSRIPILFAVVIWLLMQLALVVSMAQGGVAQVAAGSHLGGLCSGILLAFLLRLHREGRYELHSVRGRKYLKEGHWLAAQAEFTEYVRRQPKDIEGHLELARTYHLTERRFQSNLHYRTACRLLAPTGRLDRIEEIYLEAERANVSFALDQKQQLQIAQLFDRTFKYAAAERAYLNFNGNYPEAARAPLALFRAARLALIQEAEGRAHNIYLRLLERYPESAEAQLTRDEIRYVQLAA